MNRNTELHFTQIPTLDISRSKFDMSFTHKTTGNTGDLIPVYVDCDIVPGDTVTMKQSEIVRMMTPIAPVMDNAFMDFYWFFVPNRLVWEDFKKFMGENETAPWTQTGDYTIPQIEIKSDVKNSDTNALTATVLQNSLINKMGIPIQNWSYNDHKKISISALPVRAYCTIYNEFFRDENLQNPLYVRKDSVNVTLQNSNDSNWASDPVDAQYRWEQWGGYPCMKVCKPHDYFTSCLPGAQKGPAVQMPQWENAFMPVHGRTWDEDNAKWNEYPTPTGDENPYPLQPVAIGSIAKYGGGYTDNAGTYTQEEGEDPAWNYSFVGKDSETEITQLYVDLNDAVGTTINQLRQAFAIQKFYEREARGGTRYIESVWSHFRVRNPDYRLQRPEYLGGFRQNINMNQVIQNTQVIEGSTPLGTTGAYSLTSHSNGDVFSHSFTEHGILMGLACIRTEHTYQQGINRMWFKKKRLDFYTPEFANLGEQAVLNQEIYAQGTDKDKEAFGYNEAWAEMRFKPSIISGELSSLVSDSLDIWHYADYYEELPELGDKWIKETDANVERTLAVQDHDQFMFDFYFAPVYTRPLPLYSVPGLIDHH